jgi:O-antigen/teichoic acid export membrane protein
MRISKRFIKTSLIYTLAGMLPMASAILLVPLYVPYLSTDLFGELAAYAAFSLLIQVVVTFSFDTSVYIHFHEYKSDPKKLSGFISSAFIFMLLLGLAVGLLLTGAGELIFSLMKKQHMEFYPFGMASVGAGIFQSVFKVHGSLLQSRERPEVFFWSNVISFALIAACTMTGLILYPQTLVGPVTGRLVASIMMGCWALARIFREFGFHADFTWLRSSLSFNVYSFLYQVQLWVVNYFDRILLLFYIDKAEVGVYDFGLKCMVITELLMNGLHNSFYPKVVSEIMAQPTKGFTPVINRYYHGLTAVIMVVIALSMLFFPLAVDQLIHKDDWRKAMPYLPYLAVVYTLRIIRLYFAVPYAALKMMKPMPVIYAVVALLKVGFVLLLVNQYHLYGAIVATLISGGAELILLRIYMRRKFHFRFNVYKIVVAPCALLAMVLILEPVWGEEYGLILHTFYLIACLSLLSWVYRNEVKLIDPFKLIR